MNNTPVVLALDIGTTTVKALLFDEQERLVSRHARALHKVMRVGGIVEQDPMELLQAARAVLREAYQHAGDKQFHIQSMGITNQRETSILWDERNGDPIYPAIVWEDTRTRAICQGFDEDERALVQERTGLTIDPYFSATKIAWIIDHYDKDMSHVRFGTVDTWILWNICDGHPHVTDITNASRTLLFNIITRTWDRELCELFGVPSFILPNVHTSGAYHGTVIADVWSENGGARADVGVCAMMGDQEASMFAAGSERGDTKVTYGTGTFIGQIIGNTFALHKGLFTTPTAEDGQYMVEAKIDCCGRQAEPLIGNNAALHTLIDQLTAEVCERIAHLPVRPRRIMVDGGLTQEPYVRAALERAIGVTVEEQRPYDGTALGVACMLLHKPQTIL